MTHPNEYTINPDNEADFEKIFTDSEPEDEIL